MSAASKIRVLLIAPSLAIVGGQSVQAAKLVSILGALPELEVRFFPIDPNVPPALHWVRKLPGLRTILMSMLYFVGLLRAVPQSDILHVFTAGLSSYTLWTIPALLCSRLFRKRFVMHYHDGQAEQHLVEWRSAGPTVALADCLVVPSGFLLDVFTAHGIRAEVISNIVELDRFVYRQRTALRPVFMTNRMLEPHYNLPCILRAFEIVQRTYPEASLVIAHDGPSRPMLEQMTNELHLQHVSFIGRVAYEDVPRLYEAAEIYVMTPNVDNMPGSLLECFASGVPVITTKAGGIPYIAEDRRTALLVNVDDHEGVAACALELLSDPELVQSLTEEGAREVQRYGAEPVRDAWLGLYRRLIRGNNGSVSGISESPRSS